MFLGEISNLPCSSRLLHREDYVFLAQAEASAKRDGSGELVLPRQYWLLGFKDRKLEKRYLDQLALKNITRLFLGYACYIAADLLNIASWLFIYISPYIDDDTKVCRFSSFASFAL